MADNSKDSKDDRHRDIRIKVARIVSDFLQLADSASFKGSLTIEIPAKAGHLGAIKNQLTQFVD